MRMTVQGVGTEPAVRLRPARREDTQAIARLFLMSSDGLAAYIWSRLAEPGADLVATGGARYARENTAFSYQNCHLAEVDGKVAGMLHAFEMTASAAVETDPVLRPYAELEDPGSLYIAGLAVFPEYRRKGLARGLMALADTHAQTRGLARQSLICFNRNLYALSLYADLGFAEIDRRAVIPHPSLRYQDGFALLLGRSTGITETSPL
ncbi:GNAT family N-acetyltransferase [uncultured Roseobacter sp.]|uniref:GNAT family N-acetyltransferase n=1 Tax=uncultured Roseobacter sp. TaxID=114847 RepID=UPI0026079C56|nr:GNAT family N-acetyltransferase [uncultured Roseobacter sp.]